MPVNNRTPSLIAPQTPLGAAPHKHHATISWRTPQTAARAPMPSTPADDPKAIAALIQELAPSGVTHFDDRALARTGGFGDLTMDLDVTASYADSASEAGALLEHTACPSRPMETPPRSAASRHQRPLTVTERRRPGGASRPLLAPGLWGHSFRLAAWRVTAS